MALICEVMYFNIQARTYQYVELDFPFDYAGCRAYVLNSLFWTHKYCVIFHFDSPLW